MFDVGFQELILVAIVALIVVGPERLPRVARVAGKWVGHARRTLANVKHEIDRELKAEELKRILEEQARHNPFDTILEVPAKTQPQTTPPAESQTTAIDLLAKK
ncbi:Sec-independent protein translocase protein TatB [Thermochromatium tepidum]|uniref:Sec-independent protein translocase protein TatB n=1 Tax=Thermochromatium tepidum ATCC 43061 TaxID=316276 RepID=A0A6I6E326_THETI|nr:Sec-independent protein translocase protein TatB [Thermochromatium tepidum]QGU33345.1 twin-arginine translocase subunit TatB [Thermochromatium tepidum ATCC 43061]